jgi:aldehyde dehydrogenase (NAD+)
LTGNRSPNLAQEADAILQRLGVSRRLYRGGTRVVRSPLTGESIADVHDADADLIQKTVEAAAQAFRAWRIVPAPRRGELVRLLGAELRATKDELGRLVTIEAGKIAAEGRGEVQEMIDICDFAVGLSRQLYGLTIASERPAHRMMEQWHPLGPIGVITSFNFPVAVWSWNAALAFVCGDPVVWKPSEKTPLTALAVQALLARAVQKFGDAPEGLSAVLIGDRATAAAMIDDQHLPLVSATGSTAMGRSVGPRLAQRFARAILELGGNNAAIVCPSADLEIALRAIAFAAIGTAGQRCTTLRRLFVHRDIYTSLVKRLRDVYATAPVGNPVDDDSILVGPLIDEAAFAGMRASLAELRAAGAQITGGERWLADVYPNAYYVRPALVELPKQVGPVLRETFAPLLYLIPFTEFDEALALHNGVPQGLASSIFSNDMREIERFLSAEGSDCGIVNVNIGPSGAEIGGAFGGEKETGGGREAGSDVWKSYMRRVTSTINFGRELPLAQGIRFDIG